MDNHRNRHTKIPNELLDDPEIDAYALRLYAVIRRRDWDGAGWEFSWAELQQAVGCSHGTLVAALKALRDRGYLRVEGPSRRRKRFFVVVPDGSVGQIVTYGRSNADPPEPPVDGSVGQIVTYGRSNADPPYEQIHRRSKTISSPHGERAQPPSATPTWIDGVIDQVGTAVGWTMVGDATRAAWAPLLVPLASCTADQRGQFAGWLVSGDGFWRGKGERLHGSLRLQAEAFVSAGCPAAKPGPAERPARGPGAPRSQHAADVLAEAKTKWADLTGGHWDSWKTTLPPEEWPGKGVTDGEHR